MDLEIQYFIHVKTSDFQLLKLCKDSVSIHSRLKIDAKKIRKHVEIPGKRPFTLK